MKLPAWVVDNDTSVRAEAAPWRDVPVAEKAHQMKQLCQLAARFVRARPDAHEVLAWRDPLPESTVVALRRLRARP